MTQYPIIVYPTPADGACFPVVPALPGRTAHGETAEDVMCAARVAMRLGQDVAVEVDLPILEPSAFPAFGLSGEAYGFADSDTCRVRSA